MNADAAALRTLLVHEDFLRRLAGRLVDSNTADDVVQETWLTALRRAPSEVGAAKAWLAQVARNVAAMDFRGRDRARRRENAAARPEAAPSTAEIVERESVRREVVDALLRLDALYRDALLLRYERDLPPRKVAAALGVPVETARSRIKRGLELLRGELETRRGPEQWRRSVGLLLGPTVVRAPLAVAPAAWLVAAGAVVVAAWVALADPPAEFGVHRFDVGGELAAATAPRDGAPSQDASVARERFVDPGFTIVSEEDLADAFPCAEPLDAEGRPTIAVTRLVDLVTGRPLPGGVVALELETLAPLGEPPRPIRTATADAAGWARVRIDDLQGRAYGFFATAPGCATLADLGSRPDCPAPLAPSASRRVRVLDHLGEPLAGLRLDLVLGCGHHASRARFTTDAAGEATIEGLGPDGASLWPVDARVVCEEHEILPAAASQAPPAEIVCAPSVAVQGRVVRGGVPVGGIYVGIPHTHRGPWARTAADGRFELFGAPPEADLEVVEAPLGAARPENALRVLGAMARPVPGREAVIDLSRRGVDATEPAVELAVRCVDETGALVAGVAVIATGATGDAARSVSDASGVASLVVFPGAYDLATDDPFSAAELAPKTVDVVGGGRDRVAVTARVERRPRLRCVVTSEAENLVVRAATRDGVRELTPEERAGGRAFFVPRSGPLHLLAATPDGPILRRRLDAERDRAADRTAASAANAADAIDAAAVTAEPPIPVDVPPYEPPQPPELCAPVALLSDALGAPLVDAEIVARKHGDPTAPPHFARSGPAGEVRFADPTVRGEFDVAVRADGRAPYFTTFACEPSAEAPRRLALPTGSVTVHVADENGAPLRHATVLLDGEPLFLRAGEASSVTWRGVTPGAHEIVVAAPGRTARRLMFELSDGAAAAWTTRLRSSP